MTRRSQAPPSPRRNSRRQQSGSCVALRGGAPLHRCRLSFPPLLHSLLHPSHQIRNTSDSIAFPLSRPPPHAAPSSASPCVRPRSRRRFLTFALTCLVLPPLVSLSILSSSRRVSSPVVSASRSCQASPRGHPFTHSRIHPLTLALPELEEERSFEKGSTGRGWMGRWDVTNESAAAEIEPNCGASGAVESQW